jgi:YVTN family beta-propeller protein
MRRTRLAWLAFAFVVALAGQALAQGAQARAARPSLTITPGKTVVRSGSVVVMAGTATAGAGRGQAGRVTVQQRAGHGWSSVASGRVVWQTARRGLYSVRVRVREAGRLRFRAVMKAGGVTARSRSCSVKALRSDEPLPRPSDGWSPGAPGPQPNGSAITPNGWAVTPAGSQTALQRGPLAMALSPSGRFAIAVEGGFYNGLVEVLDTTTGAVVQTSIPHFGGLYSLYAGATFSADGKHAYVSDGPQSAVLRYDVSGDRLVTPARSITLPQAGGKYAAYPAGLAVTKKDDVLYVAANTRDTLNIVNLKDPSPDKTKVIDVGHRPYAVVLSHDETSAFVSSWGGTTVVVVDTQTQKVVASIPVGCHPSAMALNPVNDELYVANSDSDTVSVIDTTTRKVVRAIDLAPYERAPIGASPNALTVSPDGHTLYVANAGDNDIAVIALSAGGGSLDTTLGLIPTAWYPCSVALSPDAGKLYVLNMKGMGIGPVGTYRQLIQPLPLPPWQFILKSMRGSFETVPVPSAMLLAEYTAQVARNDHFGEEPGGDGTVVPTSPVAAGASPIKHIIYVIKENRSYDQILGDLGRGNGDDDLVDFDASVTPNQHKLAKQFVTLDNFYADGEVSMDGWSWANAANCNTYTEKNVPLIYSSMFDLGQWGITSMRRPDDEPGFGQAEFPGETAAIPGPDVQHAYFWDKLAAAGISFRNFGFFIGDAPKDDKNLPASMPNLRGHTALDYAGWDLNVSDQKRADLWLKQFASYKKTGAMPTVQFVYLPRDHTWTLWSGKPGPAAMVADNDLALGRIVDAVSHSAFWKDTAIFVTEDDAQDGADHVDGHRTVAQVISPYSQTGKVDSTFYSTVSMLHTMELIVGVTPMTQFDATSTPMWRCFTSTANLTPYTVKKPRQSLTQRNPVGGPMSAVCERMDFSHPDGISPLVATKACWLSSHGSLAGWPPKGVAANCSFLTTDDEDEEADEE